MKQKETEFLENLFSVPEQEADNSDTDFPLLDVPEGLSDRLYAISNATHDQATPTTARITKYWPKITGIAASILVAVIAFQMHQQQQTLNRLEQAQADLTTALHYLAEANKIARSQVYNSVNANMQKAAIDPIVEIGRDAVVPNLPQQEFDTNPPTPTRSL